MCRLSLTGLIYTSESRLNDTTRNWRIHTRWNWLNTYHPELAECIPPHECGTMPSSEELEVLHEEEAYEIKFKM